MQAGGAAETRLKVAKHSDTWVVRAALLGDSVITQPMPVVQIAVVCCKMRIVVNFAHLTCKGT